MNRDKELQLIEAALAIGRAKEVPLQDEEALIPTAEYIDPERFDRERQALFRRSLNVVGLSTSIPSPGDFASVDVVGTPAIVVRGEDGVARALLNVCRHRGAKVELRAHGRCKNFVCPYHAWTYCTDGRLQHARHPEGFPSLDVQNTALAELACREAAGLIWVCPDPAVSELELDAPTIQILEELEGLLGPKPTAFATAAHTWRTNWKLVTEGGLESYHFRIAHRNTIASLFGDTDSSYELIGNHVRSVVPRRSLIELEDLPREQWHLREHANILYTLHPNAMLLVQNTHVELIIATPIAVDQTRIEMTTLGRDPGERGYSDRAREFLQRNHDFTVRTLTEDFELAEQIQAGIKTGANEYFRFGRFEGALTRWHRRIDQMLAAG